jgi:hypothetical protein
MTDFFEINAYGWRVVIARDLVAIPAIKWSMAGFSQSAGITAEWLKHETKLKADQIKAVLHAFSVLQVENELKTAERYMGGS